MEGSLETPPPRANPLDYRRRKYSGTAHLDSIYYHLRRAMSRTQPQPAVGVWPISGTNPQRGYLGRGKNMNIPSVGDTRHLYNHVMVHVVLDILTFEIHQT